MGNVSFGYGYALIRLGDPEESAGIVEAAEAAGMPLTVLDIDPVLAPPEYVHRILIVSDDQHVAWRDSSVPADPGALIDRLRGRLPAKVSAEKVEAEPLFDVVF